VSGRPAIEGGSAADDENGQARKEMTMNIHASGEWIDSAPEIGIDPRKQLGLSTRLTNRRHLPRVKMMIYEIWRMKSQTTRS
jgi:hypothetical protein